jgi:hypothetical protein
VSKDDEQPGFGVAEDMKRLRWGSPWVVVYGLKVGSYGWPRYLRSTQDEAMLVEVSRQNNVR